MEKPDYVTLNFTKVVSIFNAVTQTSTCSWLRVLRNSKPFISYRAPPVAGYNGIKIFNSVGKRIFKPLMAQKKGSGV